MDRPLRIAGLALLLALSGWLAVGLGQGSAAGRDRPPARALAAQFHGELMPDAITLSPTAGVEYRGDVTVPVQIAVRHLSHRLYAGAVDAYLQQYGTKVPVSLDVDREHTYRLLDGWESQFTGEIDTSKLAEGFWTLFVKIAGTGVPGGLLTGANFSIGVPSDLIDLVGQREAPMGWTVDPVSGGNTIEWAQTLVGEMASYYVDPANGAFYHVGQYGSGENILQQALGKPDWLPASAPYADRVAEVRKVLEAFSWQVAGPTEYPTMLFKQATTSRTPNQSCADSSAEGAGVAPGLYAQAQASAPAVRGDADYTVNAYPGTAIGENTDYGGNSIWRLNVVREIYPIVTSPGVAGTPYGFTGPVPTTVVDQARLIVRSTAYSTDSTPLSGAVTVNPEPAGWTPAASDWDGGAGAVSIGSTSPALGATPVIDALPVPVSVLRGPSNDETVTHFVPQIGVGFRAQEPPPDWPPSSAQLQPYCSWVTNFEPSPELIFHQNFPAVAPAAPLPVISPSSLDAENGDLTDLGALDFGNQALGGTSPTQTATITNGGGRPLTITNLVLTVDEFTLGGNCKGATLDAGHSCHIDVAYRPAYDRGVQGNAAVTVYDNAASGRQTISLTGVGTKSIHPPATLAEEQGLPETVDCHFLKRLGWKVLPGPQPEELAGQVIESHVASEDSETNHQNVDFNWFIYPDYGYRLLEASPGNWHTGDEYEAGRMEVEWERASPRWAGLPAFAWPMQGDRAYMVGQHVFDCGHADEGHRSEIHPPQFVAVYRNAALARLARIGPLGQITGRTGSSDPATGEPATQVDVYASSYGGDAIGSEQNKLGNVWYQPVARHDYQFVVMAPPKPVPDAQLYYTATPEYRLHSGGVEPAVQPLDDRGYLVTLPMTRAASGSGQEEIASGWRLWVGWKAPDLPPANLRTYEVTFERLHVYKPLTHEWSVDLYAGDQGTSSVLTGGGENPNDEPFARVSAGENVALDRSFKVTLVPGQALRVAARAQSWTLLGGSDFLGTAESILPDPGDVTLSLPGTGHLAVGFENDIDKVCQPSVCFSVLVRVRQTGG